MSSSWPSRSELLRAQVDTQTELRRRYNAVWPALRVALAAAVVAFAVLLLAFAVTRVTDDSNDAASALPVVLIVVALAIWPVRVLIASRRSDNVVDLLAAWRDVDASDQARDLPADDVPDDLRTPWDARFDPDFDAVMSRNTGATRVATGETGSLLRSVLGGLGLGAGLVLVLIAAISLDDPPMAAGSLLSGLVLAAAGGGASWQALRYTFGVQRRENRMAAERQLIGALRTQHGIAADSSPPAVNPVAKAVAATLLVLVVGYLAVRIASASAVALITVVVLIAVLALTVAGRWQSQRRHDTRVTRRVSQRRAGDVIVGGLVRPATYGLTTNLPASGAIVIGNSAIAICGADGDDLLTVSRDDVHDVVQIKQQPPWLKRRLVAFVLSDGSVLLLWSRLAHHLSPAVLQHQDLPRPPR